MTPESARQALAESGKELELERDAAIEAREVADAAREDAVEHQRQAEQEKERAVEAEAKILHQAYDHGILLAGQAFEEHDLARARRLLDSCPQRHRSWEWHWLSHQVDDRYQPMEVPQGSRVLNTFDYSLDGQRMVQLIRDESPAKLVLKDVRAGEEIWRRGLGTAVGPAWSPRFVGKSGSYIRVEQANNGARLDPSSRSPSRAEGATRTAIGNQCSVLVAANTGKTVFTAGRSEGRLVLNRDESGFRIMSPVPAGLQVERWAFSGDTAEKLDAITLKMPNNQVAENLSGNLRRRSQTSILSEDCQRLYLVSRQEQNTLVQCWDTQRGEYRWEKTIETEQNVPSKLQAAVQHKLALDERRRRLILLVSRGFRLQITDLHTSYPATAFQIDTASGAVKGSRTCPLPDAIQHSISADGQFVASSNRGRTVCVWDPVTGRESNRFLSSGSMIFGPLVRSGHLWLPSGRIKVESPTAPSILSGHKQRIVSLAFDATGNQIVSSSADETIRVWNINDCSETLCIPVRSPGIARFTSDGRIAHKSADGVQVRSVHDNQSSVILLPSSQELQPADVGSDDELVGLLEGHVRRWDLATGELTSQLLLTDSDQQGRRFNGSLPSNQQFYSCGISEDGTRAALVRRRGGLVSYDLESGEARIINANLSPDTWRFPPKFKPGTNNVVAMTDLGEIRMLDLDTSQTVARLQSHSRMITHIAFSHDGKRLFSIDREGKLVVWNADNGEQLLKIPRAVQNGEPVVAMAVSPDGNTVALADFNEIRLLETSVPSSEQIARRQLVSQAAQYVNQCFEKTRFVSVVLETIRQEQSIGQEVRTEAVRIAKIRGDLIFAAAKQTADNQLREFVQRWKASDRLALEDLLQAIDEAAWLLPEESVQDRHWRMSQMFFGLAELGGDDDQFDAKALFDELLALTPEKASLALFQAQIEGYKGNWPQVAKAMDAALKLTDSDYRSWLDCAFLRALLFLKFEDVESYHNLCRQAVSRYGVQSHPENALRLAKMCLVCEDGAVGLETLQDLLADLDPAKLSGALAQEYEIVHGVLDYREDKFDAVVERLGSSGQRPAVRNRGGRFPTMTSAASMYIGGDALQSRYVQLYLAMAIKQTGDETDAMQRLTKADDWPQHFIWQHRLMFDIARAEAANVFGQKATVTPTAYGWSVQVQKPPYDRPVVSRTTDETHRGAASLLIEWSQEGSPKNPRSFGQSLTATPYLGKRIRLTAYASSQNLSRAGLWMSVDGSQKRRPFDNMMNRPIRGTTDWQAYSIVLDVPEDATSIVIGGLMIGRGKLWLDDFALEAVGPDVALTDTDQPLPELSDEKQAQMKAAAKQLPRQITNGGFEQPQRLVGLKIEVVDGELTVNRVFPDSVGESAGFQAGDIIVSVDGRAVHNMFEFIDAIHEGEGTKEITLRVDGQEKTVRVEFPE